MDRPEPGDKVIVTGGRYRKATGTLVESVTLRGPSGALYRFAIVKRPRAGNTVVFEHEVAKA
jgi:hypothetical protein